MIEIHNPVPEMLLSQLEERSLGQVKKLASSFLSTRITAMEYDLQQASGVQGGVLFRLVITWFLHFKLGKIQPLLIQLSMGLLELLYSPLFQVYVSLSIRPLLNKTTLTKCFR